MSERCQRRRRGARRATHVTRALEEDASDLALLDVGKPKLEQSLARIDVILCAQLYQPCSSPRRNEGTSLLIRTIKTPLRISVFIPWALASFVNVASEATSTLRRPFCCASTRGSPPHAAPTIHHLPLEELERISARERRRASGLDPASDGSGVR